MPKSLESAEKIEPPTELSVGQVAARSGVAVSAIHFYEARGLINGRRTAGNKRRYSRAVLRHVAVALSVRLSIPSRMDVRLPRGIGPRCRPDGERTWMIGSVG